MKSTKMTSLMLITAVAVTSRAAVHLYGDERLHGPAVNPAYIHFLPGLRGASSAPVVLFTLRATW